ncbi:glycosyltransferase family 2 protein [Pedobacter frigiditerrae]|uniref:Glycosyltransferase family 2 protein n=1 Tax=Pedobacter frigiditerrae TaxID=2530452 RepID=A0A4R0N1U2_9SPHI|nr:glycosyltransferase family 2 protein [Pedobacter frigiditerrae]TCC92264.1 glycosyltransferase family 2 protein [Pedobacter frigiditerrae]
MKVPVSVVILTFNEEKNIRDCIESILDFTDDIFVVDSGSTDKTLEILSNYPVQILHNPFENYSQQRNWSLKNIKFKTEWVLNLDADHRATKEFKEEVEKLFLNGIPNHINGLLTSRRTMFMGKWIKYGGHYPTYHAALFRLGRGKCENKLYDQHFLIEGDTLKVKGDIIDLITESLSTFTQRHDKWSSLEAIQQFENNLNKKDIIKANVTGNPIQKRRFYKNIYEQFPLFVRPFIYFFIRYFLKFGFLDGKRGLIFHFLQCFWFRFLIDAKIYELKKNSNKF